MSAPVQFTALTNPTVLWPTMVAANNFFHTFYVGDADTSNAGVMKKAVAISWTIDPVTDDYVSVGVMQGNGTIVAYDVPSRAAYDSLKTQFDALATAFDDLVTSLQNAGHIG